MRIELKKQPREKIRVAQVQRTIDESPDLRFIVAI